jgi:CubicO group peptidase (beta-lactamase class C family)
MNEWAFAVRRRKLPVAGWMVVAALLLAAASVARADDSAPMFPSGEPGRHAEAWFRAYNAGEDSMRAFLAAHVAPAALARRPVESRLEIYREMRAEHGALTPLRVADGGDSSVTVSARAAIGPALSIEFECDPDPPHGLLALRVQDDESVPSGGGGGPEPAPGPALSDPELAAAFGAAVDSLARDGSFSGAVLLARGATPLLRRAYGLADRSAKRANRPETKFNLGSVNKIFTHVAILQLAEQGKLRLTDTIDRFLPDYPKEKGSKITIGMLLEHRGGTGDIFRDEFREKRLGLKTGADWYAYVRDLPLEFEPGTRRAYSNVGFVLLGSIVESVSGESYYDYVRKHVFEPAGMKNTDSYAASERVPDRAVGYTRDDERGGPSKGVGAGRAALHSNDGFLPARGSAAGGGYSTLDDLARFVEALRGGKLLGPENSALFVGPNGGLGIAGGSPGVNAALVAVGPYTVVVLSNLDPPSAERVASKARRLVRGGDASGGPAGHADAGRAGGDNDAMMRPLRSDVPAGGVEVPMTMATHLPAVDVMVNGKGPFRFAIDTGGSGAARVDSAFAATLGLPVVGEVMGGDPSGKNQRRMGVVAIDSLSIGGARFAILKASTRDYNEPGSMHGVDGILGFGLFSGYTVTFDYPGGLLRIEASELPPVDGKRILAYSDDDGIPSIHIQVDSLDMAAHVDAGSMGGFILPERLLTQLPLASPPVVIGKARTVSNTFEIKGAQLRGTLRIGDLEFADPRLEFQPIMPDANVGSRILKDFRLSFDTKNKRIRFSRAS